MNPKLQPDRTHAIIVGIGSFKMGPEWALPAAPEHAVEFCEWLRSQAVNVPENNIHLFLSEVDTPRFTDRLSRIRVQARVATYSSFDSFMTDSDNFRTLSGDLLYFYWSGHGTMRENEERLLFFEDWAEYGHHRRIELKHFLKRLRSEPLGRFPTQIAYVDACANYFESSNFASSSGEQREALGAPVQNVKQVFLLAADSGQQAQAGEFSGFVLQALEEQFSKTRTWPPDPDAVLAAVRPNFEGWSQRPVQIAWRTAVGDEESRIGDLPSSRFVNAVETSGACPVRHLRLLADIASSCRGLQKPADRDILYKKIVPDANGSNVSNRPFRLDTKEDLLRIVATAFFRKSEDSLRMAILQTEPYATEFSEQFDRILLLRRIRRTLQAMALSMDDLRDTYELSISTLSREPARQQAATLHEMLDELCVPTSGDERFFALYRFLMRLSRNHAEANTIKDLINQTTSEFVRTTLNREIDEARGFCLRISVEPNQAAESAESGNASAVAAQLFISESKEAIEPWGPWPASTWSEVELLVQKIVRAARKIVIRQYKVAESQLYIEFLLPAPFLLKAPDVVPFNPSEIGEKRLGQVHPVVVRWRERLLQPEDVEQTRWRNVSEQIATFRKQTAAAIWLDMKDCGPFCIDLGCKYGVVALLFCPASGDTLKALYKVIDSGYPFIAWVRQAPLSGDFKTFQQEFETWIKSHLLESTPRQLREVRSRSIPRDLAENMTLFWDDPDEDFDWKYTDVSLGGTR